MRALVTGGAGFIGGHLSRALAQAGHEVTAFDDLSAGDPAACAGVDLVVGDICNPAEIGPVLEGREVVFHLAARRSVPRSIEDPEGTTRVNVGGTVTVLEQARLRDVGRVIVTSSSSVYGGLAPLPTPEDAPLRPRSPYAASKAAAELFAATFQAVHAMEVVVVRPFNVFGPGQTPGDPYAGVVSLFARAALDGSVPTIFGDGSQSRDFTYISDVVELFQRAADLDQAAGRTFNFAAGGETTVGELWTMCARLTGSTLEPLYGQARVGDVPKSRADVSAIESILGFRPQHSVEEGLKATIEWMRSQG